MERGREHGMRLCVGPLKTFVSVVFIMSMTSQYCYGNHIVLAMDSVTKWIADDLEALTSTDRWDNATFSIFRIHQTMSSIELLTAAQNWTEMDNDTTVVDMTSDCRITALAAIKNILLLRASLTSCRDVVRDVQNVRPTLETYTSAAFSYLRSFGSCLARVVLLTEHQTDLLDFPKCYKGTAVPLLARAVGAWPLDEEQLNQTQNWLKGVSISKSALHYLIAVGSRNFLDGLIELGWLELLSCPFFHWLFVVTDTPSFNCSGCPHNTPIFHHTQRALQQFPLPFISHSDKVEVYYVWKAIEAAEKMQNSGNTFPDTPVSDAETSLSENVTLTVDIVTRESNTLVQLGNWTAAQGLQIETSLRDELYDPSIIRVATLESPPFVYRVTDENGTHYEGYAIDVLDEIAQRMQINYSFTEPSDGQFGVRLPNGTWNGVLGDIVAGSVDIAVGAFTVTAEREAVVDFTTPFYEFAGIEILVKEVKQEQNLLFFVTVFSEPMWGAWFGVLLLTGFLLAAFDYLSPFSDRNRGGEGGGSGGAGCGAGSKAGDREKEQGKETFDLKEGLWLVTASFTLSGPQSTPRTLSSRMLVAGFWFFCSIIMANYTANLAAFLTTSRLTTPINSLADLAAQSKVRYSVVGNTSTMAYFERMARIESNFYELWKNISSNILSAGDLAKSELAVWDYPLGDTYVKIWSDIERTGFLSSSEEGLQKVIEGNFALIDEAPYLQYAIAKHCDLTTIGKQFSTKSYAFALPQGSPLTEQVSTYILKLQSETILEKLKQKWWQTTAEGCSQVDESDGLSFHTLGGVFLLAGVGVAAGLLLCVFETAWAWFSARRLKKSKTRQPISMVNSRTDLVQEFDLSITSANEDVTDVQMSGF